VQKLTPHTYHASLTRGPETHVPGKSGKRFKATEATSQTSELPSPKREERVSKANRKYAHETPQPETSCALRPLESRQNVPPLEVPDAHKESASSASRNSKQGFALFAKERMQERLELAAKPSVKVNLFPDKFTRVVLTEQVLCLQTARTCLSTP
jgi:hypothetical protein